MEMATMEYRRQQSQSSSMDPFWMLFCAILAIVLALIALPWVIVGFALRYVLAPWLHERLSLLLWLLLLLVGGFIVYSNLQHGPLSSMMSHEIDDYIFAAKHYQTDILHWPLKALWLDTFPVWLHTWQSIAIAGFVAELYANTRNNTAKTLRQNEQTRQRRAQRLQHRARRRTNRPTRVPDEINGFMVIGIPIEDDNEDT
jgi:hypothetical protein